MNNMTICVVINTEQPCEGESDNMTLCVICRRFDHNCDLPQYRVKFKELTK